MATCLGRAEKGEASNALACAVFMHLLIVGQPTSFLPRKDIYALPVALVSAYVVTYL